jgi:hypothetical protein
LDEEGLLVDPLVDGAELPGVVPDPPELPMFGQSVELCVFGAWPFGRVVPPPVDGWVVAFGAGLADGSAANTAAAPPTVRRPTASRAVATVRRAPLRSGRLTSSTLGAPLLGAGLNDADDANGDDGCNGWAGTAG